MIQTRAEYAEKAAVELAMHALAIPELRGMKIYGEMMAYYADEMLEDTK